jgi:hypothetical protein
MREGNIMRISRQNIMSMRKIEKESKMYLLIKSKKNSNPEYQKSLNGMWPNSHSKERAQMN